MVGYKQALWMLLGRDFIIQHQLYSMQCCPPPSQLLAVPLIGLYVASITC